MEFTTLGKSQIRASKVALGTWAIGGWMWGGSDDAACERTIAGALDAGITMIDTAPVYGFGHSEEIVGRAIAASGKRDAVVIATKVGLNWDQNEKVVRDCSPARIRQEIQDSLRRLKTSYIDLYQVHWPDPLVPIAQTAEVLGALYKEGKIRAIGVSNYSPAQIEAFAQVAPLHAVQPPYNLFERGIEGDIIPCAKKHGLSVLAYGAICRGLLGGRMQADTTFTGDDLRKNDPKFSAPRFAQYLAANAALQAYAQERYQKGLLPLAMRWLLDRDCIALWGARQPKQLEPLQDIMGWRLDDTAMQHIDAILQEHVTSPVGPEFMAPPTRKA